MSLPIYPSPRIVLLVGQFFMSISSTYPVGLSVTLSHFHSVSLDIHIAFVDHGMSYMGHFLQGKMSKMCHNFAHFLRPGENDPYDI